MFDYTSRYAALPVLLTAPDANGEQHAYVSRRFLPRLASLQILAQVTTAQGDRLDMITARTLGAPDQFWRIADANTALDPVALTATVGTVLNIPQPQPPGS